MILRPPPCGGLFRSSPILCLGLRRVTVRAAGSSLEAEFYDFLSILAYRVWHVLGTSRRGQIAVFRALRLCMVWDFSSERECVELKRLVPAGYHIGLHIKDTTPLHRLLGYPASWVAHYTAQAYALRDPVVAWGLSEVGCLRWSAITLSDPFDILGQARAHGLVYGATVSTGPFDARTIGSVARPDRELTDEELAQAEVLITDLHRRLMPPRPLTPAQVEALRLIAKGHRYADAADALQISQSALKARITAARQHLRGRSTAEAIQRAASYDLL